MRPRRPGACVLRSTRSGSGAFREERPATARRPARSRTQPGTRFAPASHDVRASSRSHLVGLRCAARRDVDSRRRVDDTRSAEHSERGRQLGCESPVVRHRGRSRQVACSRRARRRRGRVFVLSGDPSLRGELYVALVVVDSDVVAACVDAGDRGLSRSHEGIEDAVAFVGVELDHPSRQLDRERSRVPDPLGGLGGEVPGVERPRTEVAGVDGVLEGKPQRLALAPARALGRSGLWMP